MPQLDGRSGVRQFVESVLTFIILYNSLIPISLIVSMDVVKLQQAALINSDLDMYYEPHDTPAQCRRSNLVEDLGQIDYIFSDKTGTLTRNEMQFRQASIAGATFAEAVSDAPPAAERFAWTSLPDVLARGDALARAVHAFLCLLAVCHTVIPEARGDGRVVFQASSPDEAALVAGAQALGYEFTTRTPRSVYVQVQGAELAYELLQVCEFTSARKRMSTVVREPSGRIVVYCKGADTVMLPRLSPACAHVDATLQHLEAYASEGLRTLCVAMRVLDAAEYEAWARRYEQAAARLEASKSFTKEICDACGAPTAAWARAGGRGAVDAGRLSASVARRDGPAPAACTDPAGGPHATVAVPAGPMARAAAHDAAARSDGLVWAGPQHARRVHDALAYAAGHDRAPCAPSPCAAPRRAHGPRSVARRVDSRGARAGGATGDASASPGSRACASESLGPADAHGPRAQRQHVLPPEAHDADGRCRGWQ